MYNIDMMLWGGGGLNQPGRIVIQSHNDKVVFLAETRLHLCVCVCVRVCVCARVCVCVLIYDVGLILCVYDNIYIYIYICVYIYNICVCVCVCVCMSGAFHLVRTHLGGGGSSLLYAYISIAYITCKKGVGGSR